MEATKLDPITDGTTEADDVASWRALRPEVQKFAAALEARLQQEDAPELDGWHDGAGNLCDAEMADAIMNDAEDLADSVGGPDADGWRRKNALDLAIHCAIAWADFGGDGE